MASSLTDIQQQLIIDAPKEYKKAFSEALTTKMLLLDEHYPLEKTALTLYIIPFLNACPEISTLHICGRDLGNAAAALAYVPSLRTLKVARNNIGSEGATAFANNTTLKHLDISGNYLADAGAITLAANTTLETLDISYNHIKIPGTTAFACNKTLRILA